MLLLLVFLVVPAVSALHLLDDIEARLQGQSDLAGLNQVISKLTINVPDIPISQTGFSGTVTNFVCGNIQLDALSINSSRISPQVDDIHLIAGVSSVTCSATLTYKALSIFSGSISFQVKQATIFFLSHCTHT